MSTDRIAVIDVETTGKSPGQHDRIVEIAIVTISPDGTIHDEYETLVNPKRDMGPTSIHQITAADVLQAPVFTDIAGDVLEILSQSQVVAGHNVRFDLRFLASEFSRADLLLPRIPTLCTRQLRGVGLSALCEQYEVSFDGPAHQALFDARATAGVIAKLLAEENALLDQYRVSQVPWPSLPALKTPCYRRDHAREYQRQPPSFLQRLATRIHHDVEAAEPSVIEYMGLIDQILEDRRIDAQETELLVQAVSELGLTLTQVHQIHSQYLYKLAVLALADGEVSESERRDLELVARLLGQEEVVIDAVLQSAEEQMRAGERLLAAANSKADSLQGMRVCFTGELQSTINGRPITREIAEALAEKAGLVVATSVTKKLDLLVVADPNTQSGKAKKARDYGVRVLADSVFWQIAGIAVD